MSRLHPLEATAAALEQTLIRGAEANAQEAQVPDDIAHSTNR